MDRAIWVAMSGAKHTLDQQATVAHNLANAATSGFRAEINAFRAVPENGPGLPLRAYVVSASGGVNYAPGPLQQTGRPLDVALQGKGWIAVQLPGGGEAYTRSGSLQLSTNGLLQTAQGLNVAGDGGPITIPPGNEALIAADGTVSAATPGTPAAIVGRIKLVNPNELQLERRADGLFVLRTGSAAADGNVRLAAGMLEGSNVNAVQEMVKMIELARQFDLQIKMLQSVDANERQASQLLAVNR